MTRIPNDSSMVVIVLDLKKDAVFGIDGQSIALRTDDFLGVSGLDGGDLHLLVAKGNHSSTLISAFLLYPEAQQAQESTAFVRRYNPQTEEVSAQPLDQLTHDNLLSQLPQMIACPNNPRVLSYKNVVSDEQARLWKNQTNHICSSGILRIRKISSGEKLVPGAYELEDPKLPMSTSEQIPKDGKQIVYPPIPVVDSSLSIWKTKHAGTKRYLKQLTANDRTSLFMNDENPNTPIANRLFHDVLQQEYEGKWQAILGDLQLSFSLFLYLQCFASLEHWKDLVAMICLVDWKGIKNHSHFYNALLNVLPFQISSIDEGFLEDMEEAGNNFLLPLLKGLCRNMVLSGVVESEAQQQFHGLLMSKFPNSSFSLNNDQPRPTTTTTTSTAAPPSSLQVEQVLLGFQDGGMDEDEDDEDAPVVVSAEDVQASLARSASTAARAKIPSDIQQAYPLLVAAILPHEDIVMGCARILDDKRDVSLVREAAAYLEEVEQRL